MLGGIVGGIASKVIGGVLGKGGEGGPGGLFGGILEKVLGGIGKKDKADPKDVRKAAGENGGDIGAILQKIADALEKLAAVKDQKGGQKAIEPNHMANKYFNT